VWVPAARGASRRVKGRLAIAAVSDAIGSLGWEERAAAASEDVSCARMTKAHTTTRTRPSASSSARYARRTGNHLIAAGVMRFAKALYLSVHAFFRDLTATAAGSIAGSTLSRSTTCHG
jgi:hypothetical protein